MDRNDVADSASAYSSSLLAATGGVAFGAHTWSHCNLAALEPASLAEELERPVAWLRAIGSAPSSWLAYPYGLFAPAVREAALAAGYAGAFRVDGGWLRPPAATDFALPRYNVPSGLPLAGFRLRTVGVMSS